jgi:hypothetical protein
VDFRSRLEESVDRLGDGARKVAASAPAKLAGERFRGLRAMFDGATEETIAVEGFLLALVRSVRDDEEEDEERDRRDLYVAARKRRRRLAMAAFGAGPLVGVANQLADLYCETAVVCDLDELQDLGLSDEEIGAHMLVLWGVAVRYETALQAMGGDPPVAALLREVLMERAGEKVPEELTTRSTIKALWDVRGVLGDARDKVTGGAFSSVAFTGRRTKKVIERAEEQLGMEAEPRRRLFG